MKKPLVRSRQLVMRAIDEARRVATFVATTEEPCATWAGPEVVRMSGAKLERFLTNPVILNAHNRGDADCVIGRALSLKVENVEAGPRPVETPAPSADMPMGDPSAPAPAPAAPAMRTIPGLIVEIEYAGSEEALAVWDLVRTGFLRAVSIGFMPLKWMEIEAGQTDGQGDSQLVGPGVVIVEWELYEISMVPVPADPYALLQRGHSEGMRSVLDFAKLAEAEKKKAEPAIPPAPPAAPTPTPPAAPAPAVERAPAAAPPAPPAPTPAPMCRLGILRQNVLQFAPESMRVFAQGLVLEDGMDEDLARKRLKDEWARRNAPVGTPEPKDPKEKKSAPKAGEIPDDDFVRAFTKRS